MIIPGILAIRPKVAGDGWLLGSTSVLAVSRHSGLDVDGFMKAASVAYVRKMRGEQNMSRSWPKAVSVMVTRQAQRRIENARIGTASALVATKGVREVPIMTVMSANVLAASKAQRSPPHGHARVVTVLVASREAA